MQKHIFFSFLAAGFCPKNLAFARKIMVLPEFRGLQPPSPLARAPMAMTPKFDFMVKHVRSRSQCFYLSPSSTIWYRPKGGDALRPGS